MFKENGYESFAFFMEAYNKINKQKMNKKYQKYYLNSFNKNKTSIFITV